ncbi:hypothetical protein [Streptomyces gobiensis]|uniref:hypothetical protein n=1 Tax=Streptomyces gobiensis TaxID=2875706 RepID=UPI001E35A14C|nr:hypothetical protein [Streptomyces gobiensis]UGY94219.1 hypothetical protein test1122_22475 [Streptomyces gobiensis]
MNNDLGTFLQNAISIAVLSLAFLPAVVGAVRDRRIDIQLRDAEEGRDRRTGVLVTFDLAYGPHEDRVARANRAPAGRRG